MKLEHFFNTILKKKKKTKCIKDLNVKPETIKLLEGNTGRTLLNINCSSIPIAVSIPGFERYPREGNGNPLQCSSLRNSMDRGALQATAHAITQESDRT